VQDAEHCTCLGHVQPLPCGLDSPTSSDDWM
jgi:hypothetical protein